MPSRMKKFLIVTGALLAFLLVAGVGSIFYFKAQAQAKLDQVYDIQVEPIPLPFPLDADEHAAFTKVLNKRNGPAAPTGDAAPAATDDAPAEPEAALPGDAPQYLAEAHRRALSRGKNYLASRAGCGDCHGADFGGKVVIDNPAMGKWISPNITRKGVTAEYDSQDWVRLIRHGVKPDGHPAIMPCQDFTWFSDQELSDIVIYLKSVPPVDRVMPNTEPGPIFAMLLATGQFPISAETLDHKAPREKLPPELAPTVELGQHLGRTCVGCHGPNLSGGPILGGDPSWPPASNLTFHESGLAGYTLADFDKTLTAGVNKSGKQLHEAMPIAYTRNMKPVEREAMYIYFRTLPPQAVGAR